MKRLLVFWFFSAAAGFAAVALMVLLIAMAFDGAHRDDARAATQTATASGDGR